MNGTQSLGLKWKPSSYFISGGVLICLGIIVIVMGKLLGAYLIFLAGIILLIWPISRLLGKSQRTATVISVLIYLLLAYYFITRQLGDFPAWKTVLLVIWSLILLIAYLLSFKRK